MLFKLSFKNIRKSFKDYTIYFMTLVFGVAVFYIFNSLDSQAAMLELNQSKSEIIQSLIKIMTPISIFVSCILGYLIVYANNFLIRKRKKEFGIYQTLGMSKGKITKILVVETFLIGMVSLFIGLVIGVFISQGLSVVVAKMFEADLTGYQFAFSLAAVEKTGIYFGIIYLLVMVFNIITVSRFRLIQLLTAGKQNQKQRIKNPWITGIMFVASIALIGTAYYLLLERNAIIEVGRIFIVMIICGSVGTYLFFSSLAGFLLRLVQCNRKMYLKHLNMFVLNQINSKINTTKLSVTVISLMLLLTVGIMASALSMVNAFNVNLSETNCTDLTLIRRYKGEERETSVGIASQLEKDGVELNQYFGRYVEYQAYVEEGSYLTEYLEKSQVERLQKELGDFSTSVLVSVIKQSDYNKLMELYGEEDKRVSLSNEQFVVVANMEKMVPLLEEKLKEGKAITIAGKTFEPAMDTTIKLPLQNSNMKSEFGTIILADEAFPEGLVDGETYLCANYNALEEKEKEAIEEKWIHILDTMYTKENGLKAPYTNYFTKFQMEAASVGMSAMLTFIGLYLGIIFSITSAAILAIGQLSESTDNKERYAVLRRIGVDDRMINQSLFMQIGIYFMLPLVVALIHSAVGLKEVTRIISVYGQMDLTKNIILTAVFLVVVYGGYFIATYYGSKGIIKEQEKYCD